MTIKEKDGDVLCCLNCDREISMYDSEEGIYSDPVGTRYTNFEYGGVRLIEFCDCAKRERFKSGLGEIVRCTDGSLKIKNTGYVLHFRYGEVPKVLYMLQKAISQKGDFHLDTYTKIPTEDLIPIIRYIILHYRYIPDFTEEDKHG